MTARKSHRPLPWLAFGTGGFLVAFLLPIHVLIYGLLIPLGIVTDPGYISTLHLLQAPLTRVYLFILITLALLHAAYRLKDLVCDLLGTRHLETLMGVIFYSGVLAGTIAAIVLLF